MKARYILVCSILALFSVQFGYAAEQAKNEDLEKMRGKWRCEDRDQFGRKLFLNFEFADKDVLFTLTDEAGKVLIETTGEFQLEKLKSVRKVTLSNMEVTVGPEQCKQHLDKKQAYLYRIEGNRLLLIRGLLEEEPIDKLHLYALVRVEESKEDQPAESTAAADKGEITK
jgi:hypothetical protein